MEKWVTEMEYKKGNKVLKMNIEIHFVNCNVAENF